jgi:hypothetical protein
MGMIAASFARLVAVPFKPIFFSCGACISFTVIAYGLLSFFAFQYNVRSSSPVLTCEDSVCIRALAELNISLLQPQDLLSVLYLYSLAANSIAMLLYLNKLHNNALSQVKAAAAGTSGAQASTPSQAAVLLQSGTPAASAHLSRT